MTTAVIDDAKKTRLNPIWLIAAAMTVAALWNDALGALRVLARFFQAWLEFWREAWRRVFDLIEPYVVQTFPPDAYDMLTLIGTLLATIGVGQMLLALGKSERPMTTYDEIERLFGFSDIATKALTAAAVGAALLVIIIPFFGALNQTVAEAARANISHSPSLILPDGSRFEGHLLSTASYGICATLVLFAFRSSVLHGVMGLAGGSILVASALFLEMNGYDLQTNAIIFGSNITVGMLAVYVTALILVFFTHRVANSDSFELSWDHALPLTVFASLLFMPIIFLFANTEMLPAHTALWASFCAVLGLIAARSALPLVQLAIIVLGVLAIDFVASAALDVWHSVATASGPA